MAPKKRRTRKKKSKAAPPEEAPPEVDAQALAALEQVQIADVSKAANELSTYDLCFGFPEDNMPSEPLLVHEFVVDIAWESLWQRLLTDQAPFSIALQRQLGNNDILVGNWRPADGAAPDVGPLVRFNNVSAPVPTINLPGFPTHSPVVDFQEFLHVDADTKRLRSCIYSVGIPYGRDIRILTELLFVREALDDDVVAEPPAPAATSSASTSDASDAAAPKKKKKSSKKKKKPAAAADKVKPYVVRVDIRYCIHFDKKPFLVSSIIRYSATAALRKTWVDWEPAVRAVAADMGFSAGKPPSDDE